MDSVYSGGYGRATRKQQGFDIKPQKGILALAQMNAGTSSQELVFQNGHVNEGRLSLMGAHATTADLGSPMSGITVDLTEENDEEPPTKRLRLSTSARNRANSQSRREILKARLRSQILPHIIRAVYELPAGELKHDAIAVQVP